MLNHNHVNNASPRRADWAALTALLVLATIWRLMVFNGPLGSDDEVYFARAIDVSEGIWSSANYNGALRYGFNIPAGLMLSLFGRGEFQLNLWPLLCSLCEIGVVWWFCRRHFGSSVAHLAVILLVLTPIHVATASRLHADAVANFFLTLSFVLFFESENSRSRVMAFTAGLAMGAVFWVKELLGLALLTFLLWPIVTFKLDRRWLWVIAGGLVMLVGHLVLMQIIAGDPLHAFRTVLRQISTSFIDLNNGQDSAFYYVYFIIINIVHTSLIGPLAILGILRGFRDTKTGVKGSPFFQIAFWLFALLAVLSLFPVSLSPLRLAMKQSNYLGLFVAPLSILAALTLARVNPQVRYILIAIFVIVSIPLAMLEQQTYRIFVANSRGAIELAKAYPKDVFIGTDNNDTMATIEAYGSNDPSFGDRFMQLTKTSEDSIPPVPQGGRLIAIQDEETINHNSMNHPMTPIPHCWKRLGVIKPTGLGFSSRFADWASVAVSELPTVGTRLQVKLESLAHPRPATIWQLSPDDPWCKHT